MTLLRAALQWRLELTGNLELTGKLELTKKLELAGRLELTERRKPPSKWHGGRSIRQRRSGDRCMHEQLHVLVVGVPRHDALPAGRPGVGLLSSARRHRSSIGLPGRLAAGELGSGRVRARSLSSRWAGGIGQNGAACLLLLCASAVRTLHGAAAAAAHEVADGGFAGRVAC